MLLKSIAIAASVAGVLATAPAASAAAPGVSIQGWGSGNCPQGMLCIWPNWNHPPQGPTETPSVTTNSEWTGSVQGYNFYNGTGRNAEITASFFGSSTSFKVCALPGGTGGDLYIPVNVTKVSWQTTTC